MNTLERRFISATQLRSDGNSAKKVLAGIAARYDFLSSDLGGFRESLARGCFTDSLNSGRNVRCLVNHDQNQLLGSRSNGSLQLFDKSDGLHFRVELPDTQPARDAYTLCSRGDVSECSFAFTCDDDSWDDMDDPDDRSTRGKRRIVVRTVRKAKLFDVSIVLSPAYAGATSVGVGRSLFPAGVPLEIRSRFPGIETTAEERILRAQALQWCSREDSRA